MYLKTKSKLKKLSAVLPQIQAAIIASLVYIWTGVGFTYSSILVPQLQDDTLVLTESEQIWIVNCISLVIPCVTILAGILTDKFGRLFILKLSVIPHVIGWTAIALATNSTILMIGRVITGFAMGCVLSSSLVYISETASPNIRGSLLSFPTVCFAFGSLITYLKGYFITWRLTAWLTCMYGVITTGLLFLVPKSPAWLVSKNEVSEAKKSLLWLNKFQQDDDKTVEAIVDKELSMLRYEQNTNKTLNRNEMLRSLTLPTVYKPLFILSTIFLLQQFAGVNIILMNSIIYFKAIGTEFDPYLVFSYTAIVRLLAGVLLVWLMKLIGRRPILMVGFLGMFFSMVISAVYTTWIHEGTTPHSWVPFCMLIFYMLFMVPVVNVSMSMLGELFPLVVRGLATNIVMSLLNIYVFIAIYAYPFLLDGLNGIDNVQYFFSAVALAGFGFTFLFLPETHNKRLSEIEKYFWKSTFYVTRKKKQKSNVIDIEIVVF